MDRSRLVGTAVRGERTARDDGPLHKVPRRVRAVREGNHGDALDPIFWRVMPSGRIDGARTAWRPLALLTFYLPLGGGTPMANSDSTLCACGCGLPTKLSVAKPHVQNKFIHGHNPTKTFTPEEFWSHVRKGDDCWEWIPPRGGKTAAYGRSVRSGQSEAAHRRSWILANGPIPDGLFVLHRCDNPKCVRPSHLFVGTQAENVKDMQQKGRARGGFKKGRRDRQGSRHPMSKLLEREVIAIRRRYARGERLVDLAVEFKIHPTHLSQIVRRLTWTHI